jgi:PleD family two-component response regulator
LRNAKEIGSTRFPRQQGEGESQPESSSEKLMRRQAARGEEGGDDGTCGRDVLYSLMILVVDHDPEVLERAREILNRDRQVFLASTSQQAFDMVQRLGFSVVLVDLDMLGTDTR